MPIYWEQFFFNRGAVFFNITKLPPRGIVIFGVVGKTCYNCFPRC